MAKRVVCRICSKPADTIWRVAGRTYGGCAEHWPTIKAEVQPIFDVALSVWQSRHDQECAEQWARVRAAGLAEGDRVSYCAVSWTGTGAEIIMGTLRNRKGYPVVAFDHYQSTSAGYRKSTGWYPGWRKADKDSA